MGTAVSKRRHLRSDAISSVAAKVRAARAFGEYLSQSHPENCNGSDHLLSDSFAGQDSDSADNSCPHSNNLRLRPSSPPAVAVSTGTTGLSSSQPSLPPPPPPKRRLSLEHSFTAEEERQKCCECALQPARVYTITGERGMLGARGSKENLELEVLKAGRDQAPSQPPSTSSSPPSHHHHHDGGNSWFPKENMFSFQTATTTMQAAFRGFAERKRRKRELESAAVIQRNFRKHLRMVGSRRVKAQTFADRRAKSFSRSWSDPTPIKPESLPDSRDSGDLQTSCGTLDDGVCNDLDWEEEREMERVACEGDDFIPPKIMLISSKVPKAEYVPTIIRRDDPSIIPILYDHEHATFDDILEEIEKKLTAYRRGCKIWRMLLFCQGGPGHLYLLKNKVATFAKVEKEEDMSHFWRRLSRLMSKLNPEPNLIHIMGCYVLGNPNGEKLFQKLKNLMRPYSVAFESPLELSAQGKEMIETYFDFRLFRLWKTRQHSKLLDYDDLL
uniref:NMDA receptor synaptonuclear signaling and neuronal migration factor n=1 Tax=Scleropages formosus TaxID=113540 RepID=A0A8C9VSL9_SCLFO